MFFFLFFFFFGGGLWKSKNQTIHGVWYFCLYSCTVILHLRKNYQGVTGVTETHVFVYLFWRPLKVVQGGPI